ncbi:MAG TPA: Nif3-like dinuclear metal center hexameric protein [Candidatus Caccalectryoclostridium excrementigallinarum]|uniref:GTP cyclohydrolase 1 type 2 homolog n=1 Tax=Candidatus Caccalectryoclostridium excrementigallinarum TaxID=2840710 RepID=A0A9D1ML65_9FIRM|nr:Nif3-like dinuclear metal center hexameric protein [Candidatus Caccalectryoclostridium excrementigallinarum]
MKINEILQIVESYAPSALQAEYDNSGLQIGFPEDEARGVLLCVDVTPQVIEEAALKGANLVISHHPVLFNAVKSIRAGEFTSDILLKAAAARVSVYSAHTNLDCALGGLNDYLAGALGVDVDIELAGEGEFYRMGTVHGGMTFAQFAANTERVIGARVRTIGSGEKIIAMAAVSTGAGGGDREMFEKVRAAGADVVVTAEVRHDVAIKCAASGLCVIELTHYDSEKCARNILAGLLEARGVDCIFASESSPYNE